MSATDKTRVRNVMGKRHKTVAQIAEHTGLSQGAVERVLQALIAQNYTRQDSLDDGSYGYRRIGMRRRNPT